MCHNMFPTIFQSTHPSSGTLIDTVFILWPGMIDSHILYVDVSDHVPTITRVKQDNAIITCSNVVVTRLWNETTLKAFWQNLVGCDWDHVYNIKTVDGAFAVFNGTLYSKFEMTHPLTLINKVPNFKKFNKPWLTLGLFIRSRNRSKLYKDYIKGKINKDVCVRYRNFYTTILGEAKLQYYNNFFLEHKKNARAIWEQINKLKNNNSITYPKEDVTLLNDFFADLGPSSVANINSNGADFKWFVPHSINSFF